MEEGLVGAVRQWGSPVLQREPEVYCKKGNYFYTLHYQQSCHVCIYFCWS